MRYTTTSGSPDVVLKIGGTPLLFGLDTGSSSNLILHLEDAETLALEAPPEPRGRYRTVYSEGVIYHGTLAVPCELAGHVLSEQPVQFFEGRAQRLLGYGVLRAFAVTFDQERRLVRFSRPPSRVDDGGENESEG
jgi:hypothetical protein